jgi:hypothetical protein
MLARDQSSSLVVIHLPLAFLNAIYSSNPPFTIHSSKFNIRPACGSLALPGRIAAAVGLGRAGVCLILV